MTKAIATTLLVGVIACCIWLNVESWNSGDLMAVENTAEHQNAEFRVTGMTCDGCEAAVKMAVRQLDGIYQVDASYKEGSAVVSYEPSKVKPEEIKAAIEKIGYGAELQSKKGQPR